MTRFRCQNTNYYLIPSSDGKDLLAFDAGWPCSLYQYARELKTTGRRFEQIRWAMVSHFHMDHAGLIRDFQDAGIECLLFENQAGEIDEMERIIGAKYRRYRPILRNRFRSLGAAESRTFLRGIGVAGEVIRTPGHSDDSVSLITDEGDALIGDLYPLSQVMPDDAKSAASWAKIRASGAKRAWPGHAEPFTLP